MSPADPSPFVGIYPLSVIGVPCRLRCRALTAVCFLLCFIGMRCGLFGGLLGCGRWSVGVVQGSRSTPANVRQLQVEVQRLRQRVTQANAKEEKHRTDLIRSQRWVDVFHGCGRSTMVVVIARVLWQWSLNHGDSSTIEVVVQPSMSVVLSVTGL